MAATSYPNSTSEWTYSKESWWQKYWLYICLPLSMAAILPVVYLFAKWLAGNSA